VKSPVVNQTGCSIGFVSDILRGTHVAGSKGVASRQSLYSGTGLPRLCRGAAAVLVTGLLALSAGGCSFSYQLGSLFGKSDSAKTNSDNRITTGVLRPPAMAVSNPVVPPEADLAYARAAANVVLSRKGQGASQPWQNPQTGARGTVTALASAYTQGGFTCRDFLASYVKGASQSWLQGEACRVQPGQWKVRSLKPWNKS
jgi:surface antigen